MSPHTSDDWLNVARERLVDADRLQHNRPSSVASVYLAGYAVECTLKALLQKQGKPFPSHGSAGHNLRNLWRACGFQLNDLRDSRGDRTFYIDVWDTSLRYETELPQHLGLKTEGLIQGAKSLCSFLQTQMRRKGSRRK